MFVRHIFLVFALVCASSAHAATVNKVVAVVNGKMISYFDLQASAKPELIRMGINPDNPAQRSAADQVLRRTLDHLVMDILILQEADRLKVTVGDSEVDAEITRVMQQARLPKAQFESQLRGEGLTPEYLRDRVRKTLLSQKIMGMMVGRKTIVTPEEIAAYYEAHKGQFFSNRTLRMALLVYPDNVDAQAMARKIQSGAVSFESVVRQMSIGPNRQNGGDMGEVEFDRLNPEFKERLSALKQGEASEIFEVQGKRAQLKLTSAPSGGQQMDLPTATPEIEHILRSPRTKERFDEYIDQLRKKAMIDIRL